LKYLIGSRRLRRDPFTQKVSKRIFIDMESAMEIKLMVQSTPNPNALKFVLNVPVKTTGNFTYKSAAACAHNPLAEAIFGLSPSVREIYFFDNYITVTRDGGADWTDLEERIRTIIFEKIKDHDPDFKTEDIKQSVRFSTPQTPAIAQISAILDETVRPALQMDGGDIEIMDYENNLLTISYQGACGTCPSGTFGTLQAIENILRDRFNPEIVVRLSDMF
jgi:Fe-S cluster biogenesis protein NfuA